jgi:hypothetical protein
MCIDARLRRGETTAGRAPECFGAVACIASTKRHASCPLRRGWSMRPSWLEYKASGRVRRRPAQTDEGKRLAERRRDSGAVRARLALSPNHARWVCRSEGAEYPPPTAAESRRLPGFVVLRFSARGRRVRVRPSFVRGVARWPATPAKKRRPPNRERIAHACIHCSPVQVGA